MTRQSSFGLNSCALHILAMALMLCDHIWAMFPVADWMTCIGRLAFPIFAFMIAEGYAHTANVKKYLLRMLVFALLSEIPFNLVAGGTVFYPYHQNVLWTFLIALGTMVLSDKIRTRFSDRRPVAVSCTVLLVMAAFLLGTITMVDYYGAGVLTVLVFHYFRGNKWYLRLTQLCALAVLHVGILGGYYYTVHIGNLELEIVQQGLALFALLPIWLYNGRQGYHAKPFRYFCYAFYPLHLLLLYCIWFIGNAAA